MHLSRVEFMSYGRLFTDCHGGDGLHLPVLIVFIINVIYCLDKTRQFDLSHFKLFSNKSIPTEVLCFVNLCASYYFEVGDHTITIPVTCPIPVCPVGCAVHHSACIPFMPLMWTGKWWHIRMLHLFILYVTTQDV